MAMSVSQECNNRR